MRNRIALCGGLALVIATLAVLSGGQSERETTPGAAPFFSESAFLVHRLGTDHDESIATPDMNGDGWPDLLSGAYWYENPGPNGGEWKQHQFRTVEIHNDYISDCGEWCGRSIAGWAAVV